jgi:hypothetical protein
VTVYVWWKMPNLLMSNEQLRWAGLIGPIRQLRLWI